MSVFKLFGRQKVGSRTVFRLSPIGKEKAQNMEAEGKTLAVLDYLDSAGPSTISDISEQTRQKEDEARLVIKNLLSKHYVEVVDNA